MDANVGVRDPANEIVTSSTFENILKQGAIKPKNFNFPRTTIGRRTYQFQSSWYDVYPWLEYSINKNVGMCFYCRLFDTGKLTELLYIGLS